MFGRGGRVCGFWVGASFCEGRWAGLKPAPTFAAHPWAVLERPLRNSALLLVLEGVMRRS